MSQLNNNDDEVNKKRQHDDDDDDDLDNTFGVTLQDVLDSERKTNETARAVLGASDLNDCSYNKGYVYRQALYSCETCFKRTKQQHGICLACSYTCHADHVLLELYTKRNFRCDCGSMQKFPNDFKCKFSKASNEDIVNVENQYNHNFNGLYCVCDKPYPSSQDDGEQDVGNDEEEEDDDEEMIQCSVCEDWYHLRHLKGSPTSLQSLDYSEMVCHLCMKTNGFLWYYQDNMSVNRIGTSSQQEPDENEQQNHSIVDVLNVSGRVTAQDSSLNVNDDGDGLTSKCRLANLKDIYKHLNDEDKERACYFQSGWRSVLCQCDQCLLMYKKSKCEFLLRNEDTIEYYEQQGTLNDTMHQVTSDSATSTAADNEAAIERYENKLLSNELDKLNRVSQIEFMTNLNEFKQELKDFLSDFAANGKIVKRENILEFFSELNKRKKQRLGSYSNVLINSCK